MQFDGHRYSSASWKNDCKLFCSRGLNFNVVCCCVMDSWSDTLWIVSLTCAPTRSSRQTLISICKYYLNQPWSVCIKLDICYKVLWNMLYIRETKINKKNLQNIYVKDTWEHDGYKHDSLLKLSLMSISAHSPHFHLCCFNSTRHCFLPEKMLNLAFTLQLCLLLLNTLDKPLSDSFTSKLPRQDVNYRNGRWHLHNSRARSGL